MINEAVKYYNFNADEAQLIRHNENMTYKVTNNQKTYIMRIHKPIEGFNLGLMRMGTDRLRQIQDEMNLLQHLNDNSEIRVQKVVKNINGDSVTMLKDGTPVTVLEWVNGETLENIEITRETAYNLGAMIGRMHRALSNLKLSNRYNYNEVLLTEMIKECDKAHDMKHFNDSQYKIIRDTLIYMKDFFIKNSDELVLVHSDLSKSNLLINNGIISPIDFSLSGYSVSEMDLASVLSHINDESLNSEILRGYKSESGQAINKDAIDVCFCFQILLFVICQHNVVANEAWFSDKLDDWCTQQFNPLISK